MLHSNSAEGSSVRPAGAGSVVRKRRRHQWTQRRWCKRYISKRKVAGCCSYMWCGAGGVCDILQTRYFKCKPRLEPQEGNDKQMQGRIVVVSLFFLDVLFQEISNFETLQVHLTPKKINTTRGLTRAQLPCRLIGLQACLPVLARLSRVNSDTRVQHT